jgi:transposase
MKKQEEPGKKYRKYDLSFKTDVVAQIKSGRSVRELSKRLGVSESLLYKWKSSMSGKNRDQSEEIKRLKKANKRLEEENAILKKALSIFSRTE